MTLTIEGLRKLVELNMDEKCYSAYVHLIEPNIKSMLRDYLRGWQSLETLVIRMTMRSKGAYKTNLDVMFSEVDDKKKYEDSVDIPTYNKVDKMSFYKKIQYLHQNGILKDSTFALLDFLRKRRNKIHGYDPAFSDIDREAFELAHSIIWWIHTFNTPSNYNNLKEKDRILNDCEIQAFHLLNKIKEIISTSD